METVLVLRTCNADLTSYFGFRWPASGHIKAPDWEPTPACGNGLHGLLWGEGDGAYLDFYFDAKWLVVEVPAKDVVELNGKVKFPAGKVVFCGDQAGATQYIYHRAPQGTVVNGLILTGGDWSTLTGGYGSALTGGDGSRLTGGICSRLTGGNGSRLTGGYCSQLTGGDWSILTGGYQSTFTGGNDSVLQVRYWNGLQWRIVTAYVGENDIEPNTPYKYDTGTKRWVKQEG